MLEPLTWQACVACALSFVAGAVAMRKVMLWAHAENEREAEEEAPPEPWKCPDCKRRHELDEQGEWDCRIAIDREEKAKRGLGILDGTTATKPGDTGVIGDLLVAAGYVCVQGARVNDTSKEFAWYAPRWLTDGVEQLVDAGLPRERIVAVLKQGRQAVEAEIAAQTLSRTP